MQPDNQEQTPIIPQQQQPGYSFELPPGPPRQQKREGVKSVISTILILIAAPLIAIVLTTLVFQSYEVDGPSMETTLQHQDRLIVMKTGKTWASIFNNDYIPKRGEIIVFGRETEGGRQLIKRVIGLPGERVVVKNGSITVYNDEFPEGFNPDQNTSYRNNVDPTTTGEVDIVVPDGEVFVSGDNRSNSLDSRVFGTVPSRDIVGVLAVRIYPFSKFETY